MKLGALAIAALVSSFGTASASLYPSETKNLRPDSARSLCMDLSGNAKLAECTTSGAQKITFERNEAGERKMRVGLQCLEGGREGEALFLAPCRGVATQTWTYNNAGQIKNGNGLCVDVYRNEKRAGTPVITYRCNQTVNQRWARYDPPQAQTTTAKGVTLRPGHATQKCLDATADGRLLLWTCHGGKNQKFSFNYARRTTIQTNTGCLAATTPNGPVAIRPCQGGAKFMWTVERNGKISNAAGGCLDVRMAERHDGAQVLTFQCNNKPNQRFTAAQ